MNKVKLQGNLFQFLTVLLFCTVDNMATINFHRGEIYETEVDFETRAFNSLLSFYKRTDIIGKHIATTQRGNYEIPTYSPN